MKIVEVSPRDGLQNEKTHVPTETKIQLLNQLSQTGLSVVEATSFVSPKAIPQLADGADVLKGITLVDGVNYPVLVPNKRGMESAINCGVKEIAVFGAASEAFTQKNINCTIDESIARFQVVMDMAKEHDIKVRGYVSTVMGCPYQGDIDVNKVADVSKQLLDMGCYEISLGDTIGIGTPEQTFELIETVSKVIPMPQLAAHFHNTYERAIMNLVVSLSYGVAVIDSSVAGIGGCPYAQGASGNVATEDVLYMCELLGIEHGVDFPKILQVGDYISKELNRENLAKVNMDDLGLIEERRSELLN